MKKQKASRLISSFSIVILIMLSISACGTKKQYISQGKTISPDSVSQLAIGMTKPQTRIILGSPAIIDNFSGNTWVYYYSKTTINSNKPEKDGKLSLAFENGLLSSISGGEGIVFKKEIGKGGTVITEPTAKKKGIFN